MSTLYIERDLARQIASLQPMGFKDHSRNGQIKLNFRCHVCGDSASDPYKWRAWFYEAHGKVWFGCFNQCGSRPFVSYLKNFDDYNYREFIKAKYRDKDTQKRIETIPETKPVKRIATPTEAHDGFPKLPYCVRISELKEDHPARRYVAKRQIPEYAYDLLYVTPEWKKLSNALKPGTYENERGREWRLVIPVIDVDGSVPIVQGRALSASVEQNMRYLTVKRDDDALKVYGMERIKDGTVWFHEGPIDSLFIPNSLAIIGGSMALDMAPYPERRVWVLDNEPRSKTTCERIESLINAGEKIVLWDRAPWSSKDINDMITKENAKISDIHRYLCDNIVSGLKAKLRFANWKSC